MAGQQHVEVYEGRDGYWRFRLVGANGERQSASQPYRVHFPDDTIDSSKSKYNAKRGARTAHPGVSVEVLA